MLVQTHAQTCVTSPANIGYVGQTAPHHVTIHGVGIKSYEV